MVPPITISNCTIDLVLGSSSDGEVAVYLEQTTGGFPFRTRFYTFSPAQSQVNLSIRSVVEPTSLLELCHRSLSERVVNFSNIIDQSCDLQLEWQPGVYVGTNQPQGCLMNSGTTVISKSRRAQPIGLIPLTRFLSATITYYVPHPLNFVEHKRLMNQQSPQHSCYWVSSQQC